MRTIQRAKVQGIKIYLKRCETKPVHDAAASYVILFWLVTNGCGYRRKFANEETARTKFAQLIEFEKRQTVISL